MNTQVEYSIFVGGLSNSVTNTDLNAYFSQYGSVLDCDAQMWKNNPNKCRGFAIIKVADAQVYDCILSKTHKLQGRAIECKKVIQNKSELDEHSKEEQEKKVFVSGLSKKVDDETLRTFFESFGEVRMAYVVKHHKDRKSRGIGYVSFVSRDVKDKVLSLSGLTLDNKPVFCSEYSTKFNLKQNTLVKSCDKSQKSLDTAEHSPKYTSDIDSASGKTAQPKELSAKAMMLKDTLNKCSQQKVGNVRLNRQTLPKSVSGPQRVNKVDNLPVYRAGYRLY